LICKPERNYGEELGGFKYEARQYANPKSERKCDSPIIILYNVQITTVDNQRAEKTLS